MGDNSLLVPALDFVAVTPSNTVNIIGKARALYVGGAGDITCVNAAGSAITFVGVAAGSIMPIQTIRVNATGTSATSIVALF